MRVIAQHYVPQTYLKRFANEKEQVWVFDKSNGHTFHSNVKGVAQERYFYDLDEDATDVLKGEASGLEQPVEKFFSKEIEEPSAEVLDSVIAGAKEGIDPKHIPFLAKFMTAQLLRTREERQRIVQLTKRAEWIRLKVLMMNTFPDEDHVKTQPIIPQVDETEVHLNHLFNPKQWANLESVLRSHVWLIALNESDNVLHTSDHPVITNPTVHDPFKAMNGVASEGVEILLPLSPRHLIILYERHHASARTAVHLASTTINSADDVDRINDLQARHSYRQLYSLEPNFDVTRKRIEETPWTANIARQRVAMNGGPFGMYPYDEE